MLNIRMIVAALLVVAVSTLLAHAAPLASTASSDPLDGFTICSSADATFTPWFLTYTPDPPVSGQSLALTVQGKNTKTIDNLATRNASIAVTATKFGLTVFTQTFNICDSVPCPFLPTDNSTMTVNITLPSFPSAFHGSTVNLKAIGTNGDGTQVVCLNNQNFKV